MLPIKAPRDTFMMTHMIDKNDYNLLKQKAPQIIEKLKEFNKLPINKAIINTKSFLDSLLLDFFEVFMNQICYGSVINIKEAEEKWKKLDWNVSLLEKMQESAFYDILLNNSNWNKDFLFDDFIETFWLKHNDVSYLIYDYGVIEEFKYKVFLTLDHSYILDLITYFKKLQDTSNFSSYTKISKNILGGMWHSITDYWNLNRTDIDKTIYRNEWQKYKNDPKEYLVNYIKTNKSKWKIEDLK